ncbi:hypothetical protein CA13_27900 [Planctomycetes bacterium CA13]|uniref:Uncharacterized protein n=1 Tax=Novipirellula herctigrandis TaxID=2527986 RepID=A0A5C5Z1T7_9BACT|nr:hypothetical protein CA13_27900 [Planctomycetes bacterium CA13]
MTILGNTQQWNDLLDSLVPDIVELILSAWEAMPSIAPDTREDPVSDELCRRLRAAKELASLPLQVRPQIVELDSADDNSDQGRIDIVFIPLVPDESIYFALECKRINARQADGSTRRYFSEYVKEGMMRFVTGQYSHSVEHGGMLAFVLDGDVEGAIKGILKNIEAKRTMLRLIEKEIQPSRFEPKHANMRETRHTREVAAGEVLIQHFFMPTKQNLLPAIA